MARTPSVDHLLPLRPVAFPYVPGLLSFREAPVGLAALAELATPPDLVVVDGHGRAHPRRFGIACHLGVLLDRPTIGCAKSILVGHAAEPGPSPGDWTPLVHRDEVIGAALRTRARVRPVYVSVDIDVLDPAHAPGTGTPEAGGITSRELLEILRGFRGLNLIGADVVEVAPAYDHAEMTGVAASHVAYDLVSLLAMRHDTSS